MAVPHSFLWQIACFWVKKCTFCSTSLSKTSTVWYIFFITDSESAHFKSPYIKFWGGFDRKFYHDPNPLTYLRRNRCISWHNFSSSRRSSFLWWAFLAVRMSNFNFRRRASLSIVKLRFPRSICNFRRRAPLSIVELRCRLSKFNFRRRTSISGVEHQFPELTLVVDCRTHSGLDRGYIKNTFSAKIFL